MVEFEPHRRRPAVDDQLDAPAQVGEHVLRRGRRDVAGAVRRRRHHRSAEGGEDRARDRMRGHAHRDGIEAGGRKLGDRAVGEPRQHQGQRSGPERRRQALRRRVEARQRPRRAGIGHMRDQRIERGTALGVVEPRHRFAMGGVGAQAVDGLGRKGDQTAGGQHARRPLHGGGAGVDHLGCRLGGHSAPVLAAVRGRGYKTRDQAECSAVW